MKKARTKFLSLLLVLCMVVSMIPMAVFAADGDQVSDSGYLVGGTTYTLDTNGVTAGKNYLIVNTGSDGTGYALTNNGDGSASSTEVEISDGTITVDDDTNIAWEFSGSSSGTVGNNGWFVYPGNGYLSLNESGTNMTISRNGSAYSISRRSSNNTYYVRYNNGWTGYRGNTTRYVYLYEYTRSTEGEAVTFTVTPGSVTLAPNGTQDLTGTVVVGDNTYNLSELQDGDIEWSIAQNGDGSYATLSGTTVTGVADGYATVTATLKSVNGTALQENIVLTIPVTVQSKVITSAALYGNDDITVRLNGTPNYSKVYLEVTYDDDSTGVITYDKLTFSPTVDTSAVGTTTVSISYGGTTYGTMNVTVSDSPYAGLDTATSYPVYPAPGSVRLNKTASELDFESTGTVQVELSTAGISMKTGVDVILVVDVSNSMGWSIENSGNNGDANKRPSSGQTTKLRDAMDAATEFSNILLADNSGVSSDNTVSLVTFGGYDADNTSAHQSGMIDSTQTVFTAYTSAAEAEAVYDTIEFSGSGTTYNLTIGTQTGTSRGDTNYDYAFWETERAIKTLQDNGYGVNGRDLYVVFMTDGAPSNYQNYYYRYRSDTYLRIPGTTTIYPAYYENNVSAENSQDVWTDYITSTKNTYAKTVYDLVGGNMYAIGFDLAHGGFNSYTWSEEELSSVVANMVEGATIPVTAASDTETLNEFYKSLATQIRNAGTEAKVTDVIDSEFTLQLNSFGGGNALIDETNPTIDVRKYETWTADEVNDAGYNTNLIGTRKHYSGETLLTDPTAAGYELGTYKYERLEQVTFAYDADGNVSAAYSSVIGDSTNIYSVSDGVTTIAAEYFTYTKDAAGVETFKWNIGDITEGEVALTYYAYLKGSMGEDGDGAESKFYYTNEYAYLEYIDINGDYAKRDFPMPQVYWGAAITAYEFYLVNEDGEPVDRQGNVLQFEDRIVIVDPTYVVMNLNTEGTYYSKEIVAAEVLPAGYTLYDETSHYAVRSASGSLSGELNISAPGYGLITEVDYSGDKYKKLEDGTFELLADGETYTGPLYKKITAQTTIVVSANTPSYVQSHVAFGVVYNLIPTEASIVLTPDQVVLDYGKPIVIDITNGNQVLTDADGKNYDADLVGFSIYYADVELNESYATTSASDNFTGTYGVFSVSDSENCLVRYTPTAVVNGIENVFCHVKITELDENGNETSNNFYMIDWLTVIPATIVYYETDFADGVFTKETSGEEWSQLADGSTESADTADEVQNDGTIGKNQTYGYDSTYTEDTLLSDGDSWFVHGQGYDTANGNAAKTYTLFSFEGTGFDLISRTGAAQGLIKVEVFSDEAMTNSEKTISVLNKSDSSLELYQIPVVSINDLTPGTHYVRVSVDAAYTSTIPALASLNRGDEFYFDAIRIYDPAEGDSVAEAAYIADGEAENRIDEVRAQLLGSDVFYALEDGQSAEGMVFVDTLYDAAGNPGGSGSTADVMTYAKIGPNNEVYLENGQAVAFRMSVDAIPASFDIGAKTITGGAAQLSVTVTKDVDKTAAHTLTKDVQSSTAQYYNVLEGAVNVSEIFADKAAYVVITNTGADVLSITDIKVAYGNTSTAAVALDLAGEEEAYDPYAVSYTADAAAFALARTVLSASEEVPEETIPEETEPEATEPEVTEPEVTEPEATEPEATEPEATEPEATEPEVTEPEATEPENNRQEEIYNAIKQIITGLSNLLNKWFK